MKAEIVKRVLAACAAIVGLGAAATVTPGEWNNNFHESLAYAEANNVPIVVVWGNTGCSHCAALDKVLNDDVIMDWAEEHPILMVSKYPTEKTTDYTEAKKWIQSIEPRISEYPLIGVYWKKADGTVACNRSFVGRDGRMPVTSPKGDLAGQFANSLDLLVGDYPPAPTGDTSFVTADTEYDRLEAEEDTKLVRVPIQRKSTDANVKNSLKVKYPAAAAEAIPFTWGAGVTNMTVPVTILSSKFEAGEKIALTLLDADGIPMDVSSITMVEEKDNSTTNPFWIGESFGFGEWTMDLDVAKRQTAAASGDAYTFVMFTGALWCPWCQGLDAGVLSTSEFKRWVKQNKINLVELDNPRRAETTEQYKQGIVSDKPTGAPPTLLRYPAGNNNVIGKSVSGASYLSRKCIASDDAEAVLLRNHKLGYVGGEYCAPESLRSGYPTIVLLRKDGSVAGRFAEYAPTTTGYDFDENMQRFKDFLYLAEEGDYLASWRTTTTRTLGLDAIETAPFQINDATEWFKLEGPFDKEFITVTCMADRDVTLSIYYIKENGKEEIIGQPAKNILTINRPTADVLYLKASCFDNSDSTLYATAGTTRFSAAFKLSNDDTEPEKTVAFSTSSKDKAYQKALNPELYTKQSATVPVYESVNLGGKQLVGTLAVSVTAANKITAKFTGEKSVSFSGTWELINLGTGMVTTTLEKKVSKVTYTLNLSMDTKGGFEAMLRADGELLGSGVAAAGDVSAYAGSYTVTLVDQAKESAGGTGNLTIKITTAGKATVKGIMPDGTSVSVTTVLSPNIDGTATLPIYKTTSKYAVSIALAIKPNADETWGSEGDKYTVSSIAGCLATYAYATGDVVSFVVYGGYWESTTPLAICENYKLSDVLDVVIGGETNDLVTATRSGFNVTKDVLTSLSFTKSTGAFSGKAKVLNSIGKTVTATVKGVLLPGWIDCNCGGEPVIERPYGSGTLYYKVGRETVSMPIDLVAKSAE